MKVITKCTLSVLALFLIQLYGVLVEAYHFPSVLNHAWYVGSFWICIVLGVIGILIAVPMLTRNDEDEDKGIISELGYDELNTWLYCKPFFVLILVFVQLGHIDIALSCFGVWAFLASYLYNHRSALRRALISEAEKGTNK